MQISKLLNKAYPYINKKVNEFIATGIISKQNVGKSYLCHLNLSNPQTVVLLTINELRKLEEKLTQEHDLDAIISELKELRKELNVSFAFEDQGTIVLGGEFFASDITSKWPLLSSRKVIIEREDKAIKHATAKTQVLFGFEEFFNEIQEAQR